MSADNLQIKEAWEQPGPEMPEENKPEENKPEEFDAREFLLAANLVGEERLALLRRKCNGEHRNGNYYIPYASKGTYSDFSDEANYEYFKEKYLFLNEESELIGFNPDAIERAEPPDAKSFEDYLSEIDVDEWESFISDLKDAKDGQCLDEDRENELRMKAEDVFFKDYYKDFIEGLRNQSWMHNEDYQWMLAAVGTLDAEDVARLCAKNEQYPEPDGQGSVWSDLKKAASDIDPDKLLALWDDLGADTDKFQTQWETEKRTRWSAENGVGTLFDREMKEQLADKPELLAQYQAMDSRDIYAFFERGMTVAAERGGEYPRWVNIKSNSWERPEGQLDGWQVMYPLDSGDWARLSKEGKWEHVVGSVQEFVQDYVLPMFTQGLHRTPRSHPELPFKGGIRVGKPPDASTGSGDASLPPAAPEPVPEALETPGVPPAEPAEEFNARNYLLAEPSTVTNFLLKQGFKQVANGAWQLEDEHRMITVVQSANEYADLWTVSVNWKAGGEDVCSMAGKTNKREEDAKNERFVVQELARILKHKPARKKVHEAELPPAPEPVSEPDEWNPREYMLEPHDSGELVKDTATLQIIKPTEETIERFIEKFRSGVSNTRVIQINAMYMVIPKDANYKRFLIGIWEDGTLYTPPFTPSFTEEALRTKPFSKDLRRFFQAHIRRFFKEGETEYAIRMAAQLYGVKAVLKYMDQYDVPDDLCLKLGIDAAKRGDNASASTLLRCRADQLTPAGAIFILKDYEKLADLYERRYQESAQSILSGEPVDAPWIWEEGNKPAVSEITSHLGSIDYETLREILIHRTIYPYEDGQPVFLTSEILKQFENKDIEEWLDSEEDIDPEGELGDIREALVGAACQAWENSVTADYFKGYQRTALQSVSGTIEWKGGKLNLFVPWSSLVETLENNESRVSDLDDLLWGYPTAEPSDNYAQSGWDGNEEYLSECIDAALSQLDYPPYPYDPNQMTMPQVLGPDPNEEIETTTYSPYTPHGHTGRMKRKDVDRWRRDEPWRLDREKWLARAKEKGIEIPPAPSLGEALMNQLLEQEYNYATVQINVPAPQSDFVFEWGRLNIPDKVLFYNDKGDNPRELEQHITVKYGITVNEVPPELASIVEAYRPFPIYIGKVSLFRNEECDVVKLDVESPWLRKLNAEISEALPHEDAYPEYHPHLTLAYVDKGSCDALEGTDIFQSGAQTGVDPQFIVYGIQFKGAGDDQGDWVRDTLLFTRKKKVRPVESAPFDNVPFPLDPEHVKQFLKVRSIARRAIL